LSWATSGSGRATDSKKSTSSSGAAGPAVTIRGSSVGESVWPSRVVAGAGAPFFPALFGARPVAGSSYGCAPRQAGYREQLQNRPSVSLPVPATRSTVAPPQCGQGGADGGSEGGGTVF
jgi:hypothetical protein